MGFAPVEKLEVVHFESGDGVAVRIANDDIDLHFVRLDAEGVLLGDVGPSGDTHFVGAESLLSEKNWRNREVWR